MAQKESERKEEMLFEKLVTVRQGVFQGLCCVAILLAFTFYGQV